jgi:ABC-2 type transport system permease protein
MPEFFLRLLALVKKEFRQMLRDRSNLAVGVTLPVIMIMLFGYGISFDLEHAALAIVDEGGGACADRVAVALRSSKYFDTRILRHFAGAEQMLRRGEVTGILRLPGDFDKDASSGGAAAQLVLNGTEAQSARTLEAYVSGALANVRCGVAPATPAVTVVPRMWFNEANTSTWFIIPGLIGVILTLIGAFLASLLVAREWERGTFEALFVSPVQPLEIVLSKAVPYIAIGLADVAVVLGFAVFVFEVPIRGSIALLAGVSLEFLIVSVLMGLVISALARTQFLASQVALLVSFLPAVVLSGFIFDLRSMPHWIQPICSLLPATHFMKAVKTVFLVGNEASIVGFEAAVLLGYALLFVVLSTKLLAKKLA